MSDLLQITLLFDFYGPLLTQKQQTAFDLYYQRDLTLSEIGEELKISRQAVKDQLLRTDQLLNYYEEKLNLLERFQKSQQSAKEMKALLETVDVKKLPKDTADKIKNIIVLAEAIMQ